MSGLALRDAFDQIPCHATVAFESRESSPNCGDSVTAAWVERRAPGRNDAARRGWRRRRSNVKRTIIGGAFALVAVGLVRRFGPELAARAKAMCHEFMSSRRVASWGAVS